MSNTYLCTVLSRLWHSGSLSQLVGLMTQGSLLPICLSFSSSLRSLSMLERECFQPMTQLQQIREKEKAVLNQTMPNNIVLTYNHLCLHTPDKGFCCFLDSYSYENFFPQPHPRHWQ